MLPLGLLAVSAAGSGQYAAISVVQSLDNAATVIGTVTKDPQNPLFNQDKPWEPRLDNGYPNVINKGGRYQLWYGDCVKGCGSQILLYANSTDGLTWDKPNLGVFDIADVRSDLKALGKNNNIVAKGGGIGVLWDPNADSAATQYKAFGEGCFGPNGDTDCVQGTAVSADGISWSQATNVKWPSPQRYDCHNNLLWSSELGKYIATTRDSFAPRAIGIALSKSGELEFDTSKPPAQVFDGSDDHQLYSMIPWKFHNAYLSVVMVYDTKTAAQEVHCRLAWSPDLSKWSWVDAGGLTGKDFIPLGKAPACSGWEPLTVDGNVLSDCDAYRQGKQPLHHICDGSRTDAGSLPLAACREACSLDTGCTVVQWQGEKKYNFSADEPGQCFLFQSCKSVKSYNTSLASTFCMDTATCERPSASNPFDSHVCFAARPVRGTDRSGNPVEQIYYIGGNGPHSGDRNSSFALATVGPDRYAGVEATGAGTLVTTSLNVTGSTLRVTADVAAKGSLRVGAVGAKGLEPGDCYPLTKDVTDGSITFSNGATWESLVGTTVQLTLELNAATVYTIGWN